MRVLFVSPFAELGGAERCLLDMLAALGTAAPEIERRVLLLSDGALAAEATALGAEVSVLPLPTELRSWGESGRDAPERWGALGVRGVEFSWSLARRLREAKADLVHSNGMKAHLLCAALVRRTPLLLHMHDFLGQRRLSRHALRSMCSSRVRVAAVSQAVAEDCARELPRCGVEVIYNAIDTAYFSPGLAERAWLAELAGMPAPCSDTTTFTLPASFARWKGHDVFLRAAARFRSDAPTRPARWYIVGGPIYESAGSQFSRVELQAMVQSLGLEGHVGFLPFTRDIARVMRASDVIVHASSGREAFGRTIVEGMACERPVIVSAAGGAAELFSDGVDGLGFDAGDHEGLAAAMLRVAEDSALALRLARAGREHAVRSFERRRLGPELQSLYARMLRQP
jgi:glycosyltransferase involved in cell wall biosynthesis